MSNQIPETEPAVTTPPPETTATVQQAEPIIRGLENYPEAVQEIAHDNRILDRFSRHIEHNGWVVGEQDVVRLCYLAMTSRVLERPVSLAVKGPSSGGKSHVTGQVLRFFPDSAYYALTAMSEKALIYSEEDLRHRFLVLYEAESLKGDMASYLIRSLLSEGRIRYETVISSNTGLSPQMIEREGPTGLLITTTATSLHSENETRFLSVTVQDTPEQTMAILCSMAADESSDIDLSDWTGFQEWINEAEHRVVVPFAKQIAALSNPVATRLRRDFKLLLNLIKTHAILHQFNRKRDKAGQIIAELDDYAVVHELVSDVISEGIGATVSETVRETVYAVAEAIKLVPVSGAGVSLKPVEDILGLDKSVISRRVKQALKAGYLVNDEYHHGKPMQLRLGDPMPEEVKVLPHPDELKTQGTKQSRDPAACWM